MSNHTQTRTITLALQDGDLWACRYPLQKSFMVSLKCPFHFTIPDPPHGGVTSLPSTFNWFLKLYRCQIFYIFLNSLYKILYELWYVENLRWYTYSSIQLLESWLKYSLTISSKVKSGKDFWKKKEILY